MRETHVIFPPHSNVHLVEIPLMEGKRVSPEGWRTRGRGLVRVRPAEEVGPESSIPASREC